MSGKWAEPHTSPLLLCTGELSPWLQACFTSTHITHMGTLGSALNKRKTSSPVSPRTEARRDAGGLEQGPGMQPGVSLPTRARQFPQRSQVACISACASDHFKLGDGGELLLRLHSFSFCTMLGQKGVTGSVSRYLLLVGY